MDQQASSIPCDIKSNIEQEGPITYTWNIPSLSPRELDHLCIGYIRTITKLYIPHDICSICISYYNYEQSVFNEMKNNSKIKCLLTTDMLSFNSIQLYIQCKKQKFNEWQWNILFSYLPKHLSKFECIANIIQPETGLKVWHSVTFNDTNEYKQITLYSGTKEEYKALQSMDSMSIILELSAVKMYDKKQQIIMPNIHQLNHIKRIPLITSGFFTWIINDSSIMQQLCNSFKGYEVGSPLFVINGFKWFMEISYFTATTADWCIHLLSLPPKIEKLCVRIQLLFVECDIMIDKTFIFTKENSRMWIFDFITQAYIINLDRITFKLELYVLHIEYENDKAIELPKIKELVCLNGKYEWIIDDIDTINKWKLAANGTHYRSDIFELNKFKFYLKFYPNGHQNSDIGWTHLFLRLASIPSNIKSVAVYSQLSMENTKAIFHVVAKYSKASPSWGWKKNKLKTQDIKLLKEFKLKVMVKIIDVFDNYGNIITNQFVDNNNSINPMIDMPICKHYGNECVYVWKINDINIIENIKCASKGMNFLSPMFSMFGLKWYLELIPVPDVDDDDDNKEGDEKKSDENIFESTFYICLASSSPNMEDVTISYKVELNETNVKSSNCGPLYDNYSALVTGCILRIDMKNINQLTFRFCMNFIDIYDKKGNNLTERFIISNNNEENKCQESKITFAEEIELKMSDEYSWNIYDEILLNKMKVAKSGEFFLSEEFLMHGLKWIMKIYPNGSKIEREGKFNWYIYLVSLPYKISKIAMTYKILEVMSGAIDIDKTDITCTDTQYGWGQHKLKLIDVLNLNKLIFKLQMTIIDMYDNNGNIIHPNKYNTIQYPMNNNNNNKNEMKEYIWIVKDDNMINDIKMAKNGESFKSEYFEMYGFNEWYLEFYPNGKDEDEENEAKLYICLKSLPFNVLSVSFYFELIIKETNTRFHNCAHFRDDYLSKSWIITYVKTSHIKDLTQFTFSVKLQIVDVFNKS